MSINRVRGVGFAQISNTTLRDKRLSFKARGLLAMVLSHSGEWDAPRDWLVDQSHKDGREAVQSALNELTLLGYRTVSKERLPDGTFRTVVDWHQTPVTVNGFPALSDDIQAQTEDGLSGRRVSRPPVDPTAGEPVPPPEHNLQNTQSPTEAAPPLTEFTLLPADIVKAQRVTKAKAERGYAFDEWWAIVPKKVDKGHAERAYRKALTITTHERLMEATRGLVGWNALGPRKYIPNPATWLNGQRWDDEPEPAAPTSNRMSASGVMIADDTYPEGRYSPDKRIDFDALVPYDPSKQQQH